ncbi:MAG: ankyrin repeat domain-containing protein [Parachlamydiaceae bacterium]|nr:ankyrin repeat domain-containing protein [Parachlamydiaceae bacterium]
MEPAYSALKKGISSQEEKKENLTTTKQKMLRRQPSIFFVNNVTKETVKQVRSVQEDLHLDVRRQRYTSGIPHELMVRVHEIFRDFLCTNIDKKEPDISFDKHRDCLLRNAQIRLDRWVEDIFSAFKGSQEELVGYTRQEEVERQLHARFKQYISQQKMIQEISNVLIGLDKTFEENDRIRLLSPGTGMKMYQSELDDLVAKSTRDFIQNKIKESEAFANSASRVSEDNLLFVNFRTLFYETEYNKNTNMIVSDGVLEKAKSVIKNYIQFHQGGEDGKGEIIFAIDQFRKKIDLGFLDGCHVVNISAPLKSSIKKFDKNDLQKICESLKDEIKHYDEIDKSAGMTLMTHTEIIQEHAMCRKTIETYCDKGEDQPIWKACKEGDLDELKKIDIKSTNINGLHRVFKRSLLDFAVELEYLEMVEYLLKQMASPIVFNKATSIDIPYTYTPFHLAAAICNYEILSLCLIDYEKVSLFNPQPSISEGWINLLSKSTKTEENNSKHTPLHFAINPKLLFNESLMFKEQTSGQVERWQKNALAIVRILIEKGAKIEIPNVQSAFNLALKEYISVYQKTDNRQKVELFNCDGGLESTLSTYSSIIAYFLTQPISFDDLSIGVKLLVMLFGKYTNEVMNTELLKEILKHPFFQNDKGQKFLLNYAPIIKNSSILEMIQNEIKDKFIGLNQYTNFSSSSIFSQNSPPSSPRTSPSSTPILSPRRNHSCTNRSNSQNSQNIPKVLNPLRPSLPDIKSHLYNSLNSPPLSPRSFSKSTPFNNPSDNLSHASRKLSAPDIYSARRITPRKPSLVNRVQSNSEGPIKEMT